MQEIALIGWDQNPWKFEADCFEGLEDYQARTKREKQSFYPIVILRCDQNLSRNQIQKPTQIKDKNKNRSHQPQPLDPKSLDPNSFESLLKALPLTNESSTLRSQFVLFAADRFSTITLARWTQAFPIVSLIASADHNRVEDIINALLLTQRFEEQQTTHRQLKIEEEHRSEQQYDLHMQELSIQQKQLAELQSKLLSGLQQEKILHDTLLILMTHQALPQLAQQLQDLLQPLLGPLHLRILLHRGSSHPKTWAPPAVSFELHENDQPLGLFIVTPLEEQTFKKRDLRLLENISEVLSLHIPRYLAFQAHAQIETEWRATFDAISDPLILVTDDYHILDANRAARQRMENQGFSHGGAQQEPCYKALFQRDKPCGFCRWGERFNQEAEAHENELWEMSSHELSAQARPLRSPKEQKAFVHLYRNKFHQIELERSTTALAKEAETGVFKASLAHELNNPIGGLLTLSQLQKMDLKVEDPLYHLMSEIEKQALLCRDLIQDLLQKSRSS